ncbi:MAG: GNAT family N-acetyltransferase [Planctomycetes bacterium]|nr:GNAT family N-acetyltransferase [Planctomycetota bacterium]
MDLEIRKATERDLPSVLRLYGEMGNPRVLDLDAARRIFERMSTYPCYDLYVAELDGTIVGTHALLIMDNLAHSGTPSAIVEDVSVAEAHRGQGIGRVMMHHAMETARRHGCYKLCLSSNLARERAHAFYRSLGFEQHGMSFHVGLGTDQSGDR